MSVRAASLGGQAGAGGRTDVELLIALSDDTPGLRDCLSRSLGSRMQQLIAKADEVTIG